MVGARNPSKHELCFALRDECDPRWYLFRATAPTGVKVLAQLKAKRADVDVSASWGHMHNLATLKYGCWYCVECRVYWFQPGLLCLRPSPHCALTALFLLNSQVDAVAVLHARAPEACVVSPFGYTTTSASVRTSTSGQKLSWR